jgi:hypothetical protein
MLIVAMATVAVSPRYQPRSNSPLSRAETVAPSEVAPFQTRKPGWIWVILGLAAIAGVATATIANLLSQPQVAPSTLPTAAPSFEPSPTQTLEPEDTAPASPEPQPSASESPSPSPFPSLDLEFGTPTVLPPIDPIDVLPQQDDAQPARQNRPRNRSFPSNSGTSDSPNLDKPPRTLPNSLRREYEEEQKRRNESRE